MMSACVPSRDGKERHERYKSEMKMTVYSEELAGKAGSSLEDQEDKKPPGDVQHQEASSSTAPTLTSPLASTGQATDLCSMSLEQIDHLSNILQQQRKYLMIQQLVNSGSSPAEEETKPPGSVQQRVASPSTLAAATGVTGQATDSGSMRLEQIAQVSSMLQQQKYLMLRGQLGNSVTLYEARLGLARAAFPGVYGLGNPFGMMPALRQSGSLMNQAMVSAQDDRILALLETRNSDQDDHIRAIIETRNSMRVLQAAQEERRQLLLALAMQQDGSVGSNEHLASRQPQLQLGGGLLAPAITHRLQVANQSRVAAPGMTATQPPIATKATNQTQSLAARAPSSSTGQNRVSVDKALAAAESLVNISQVATNQTQTLATRPHPTSIIQNRARATHNKALAAAAVSFSNLPQAANQSQVSTSATQPPTSNIINQTKTSSNVTSQTQSLAAHPPSYSTGQNRAKVRRDNTLTAAAESVANLPQAANQSQVSVSATQPPTLKKSTNQTQSSYFFPRKLYNLLETIGESSTTGDEPCISWLPHGRAFIIRNEGVFVSKVVPEYFKQTKMRSFVRQLLLWGFTRILCGPDRGAWFHQLFIRGELSKLAFIKRTAVKRVKNPGPVKYDGLLTFHAMPPVGMQRPAHQPCNSTGQNRVKVSQVTNQSQMVPASAALHPSSNLANQRPWWNGCLPT
ncbi:hypothetical protein ACHAXN_001067 [Cyclotella atomus]